eukprot:2069903-Alexandrium_andersonii.AAC.1
MIRESPLQQSRARAAAMLQVPICGERDKRAHSHTFRLCASGCVVWAMGCAHGGEGGGLLDAW